MNIREDWPLVTFTLLFPTSVATYLFSLALPADLDILQQAVTSIAWALAAVALFLAPFHLGRPLRAVRAFAHLSSSWLARESALAALYAGLLFLHAFEPASRMGLFATSAFAAVTLAAGLGGLYASARSYSLPARPGWHFGRTLAQFAGGGISLALVLALMFFSITFERGGDLFPQAAIWMRWGALIPAIWILVQWLIAYQETTAYASNKGRLPGHPLPGDMWRYYRLATVLAGLALVSLAIAVFLIPDPLLFLLALLSEAGASWFYRLSFFARARPLSVPLLTDSARLKRLEPAAGAAPNSRVFAGSRNRRGEAFGDDVL